MASLCAFCEKKQGDYTCPKCKKLYCSLACYKGKAHADCSSEFASQQTKSEALASEEERKQMLSILKQFNGSSAPKSKDWKYELAPEVAKAVDGMDEDEDDDDDELDPEDLKALENMVDASSVEQLWRMLEPSEQKEFLELLAKEGV